MIPTRRSLLTDEGGPRRTPSEELGRVLEALDDLTWTDERLDEILREVTPLKTCGINALLAVSIFLD